MDDGKVLETIKIDLSNSGYEVQVWNMFVPDYV